MYKMRKRSTKYDKEKIKECEACGYKIDRDVNGARNIMIKNMTLVLENEWIQEMKK